jgi:pimeloyl-ACP methyl ester carboxylesterase
MPHLVFLHGPGAGACADAFHHQHRHFPNSVAPILPSHLEGSRYHDLKTIDAFDVRDRLATLKPKLLLLRGVDDPGHPPEYEKEMHEAVPGSRYVKLSGAGHFPPTEIPDKVNALIEEFVATL